MRKRLPAILLVCIFSVSSLLTACGNDGNLSSEREMIDSAQQKTESFVSSLVSEGENLANLPNSIMENNETNETETYQVNSDYMQWTYTDWQNATEAQRNECNEIFQEQLGRESDVTNLGKIFGTNPNKNLSEIIQLQKSEQSTLQEGEQPDPGHGAAAGFM